MTDLISAFKSDPDVKIELEMCSCCLNSGKLTNMQEDFENDGRVESYYNVLNRCYNDKLLDSSSPLEKYYICDLCVQRLMDSYLFKCQVIKAQETVLKILKESEYNKDGDVRLPPTAFASFNEGDPDLDIDKESIKSDWDEDILFEPVKVKKERPQPAKRKSSTHAKAKSKTLLAKKGAKAKSAPAKASPPSKNASRAIKPKKAKQMSVKQSQFVKRCKTTIRAAMDTDNIQCRICLEKFFSNNKLVAHMNSHFNNFVCEKCGKGYAMWQSYRIHMKTHEIGRFKCQHCNMIFETKIRHNSHQTQHRHRHNCRLCGESFPTVHFLMKHRRDDHSMGCPCPDCGKVIMNPSKLECHIATNHKQRTPMYSCEFCDKRFFDNHHLKLHTTKHLGKRTFTCNVCCKSFTWKRNLETHLRIHNNIKNAVCKHRGEAFVQHSSLTWHLRKHELKESTKKKKL